MREQLDKPLLGYIAGTYGTQPVVIVGLPSSWQDNKGARVVTTNESGGNDMEARIAKLEATVDHIQSDITDIKQDIRDFRKENRDDFVRMATEFSGLREKADKDFRFTFQIMAALGIGLAALIAKAFGWL